MDPIRQAAARAHLGLVLAEEARTLPAGERRALVVVQPRVLAAGTQPLSVAAHVAAVEWSTTGVVLCGRTALWAHGLASTGVGGVVDVAVPASRQLVLHPPVRVRRLAPALLHGARRVAGHDTVSIETALVQTAETADEAELLGLVEEVLRHRWTTVARLQQRCGRGIAGSARLRSVLDGLSDGAVDRLPRLLRRALEAAGVTGLESEVQVRSRAGESAYLDLLQRSSCNAVEIDGWSTHSRRARFLADRRRDRWIRRELGITTTRVAAEEVQHRCAHVVAELLTMLG